MIISASWIDIEQNVTRYFYSYSWIPKMKHRMQYLNSLKRPWRQQNLYLFTPSEVRVERRALLLLTSCASTNGLSWRVLNFWTVEDQILRSEPHSSINSLHMRRDSRLDWTLRYRANGKSFQTRGLPLHVRNFCWEILSWIRRWDR